MEGLVNFWPPLVPTSEDLAQALKGRLSPGAVDVAGVLARLRLDEKAMRAFPDLNELLWIDVNLLADELRAKRKSSAKGGFVYREIDDLVKQKILVYEHRKLSNRPSIGFRFLPRSAWDIHRDVGACPVPGDLIIRPIKERPGREVVRVNGELVVWRWFDSRYSAVQFREHDVSLAEWDSWVHSAKTVIRVEEGVAS
jgi:hypothetical protein